MKEVKVGGQMTALVHLWALGLRKWSARSVRAVTMSRCRCTDDPRDERMPLDQIVG